MKWDSRTARLAGVGALVVYVGVVFVFAGFVWLMHPVRYGGTNPITFTVACLAVGVPCLLLIAAHIAVGRQLLEFGKGL
jgi:NADH:ubiquinone oxidoreductase subunit 6 (subunit J)